MISARLNSFEIAEFWLTERALVTCSLLNQLEQAKLGICFSFTQSAEALPTVTPLKFVEMYKIIQIFPTFRL